jgi:hypothetical protein
VRVRKRWRSPRRAELREGGLVYFWLREGGVVGEYGGLEPFLSSCLAYQCNSLNKRAEILCELALDGPWSLFHIHLTST